MSNQFALTQAVANKFLMLLKNNLVMGRLASDDYTREFIPDGGVRKGTTINVRRPVQFVASSGPTFVQQDVTVGEAPITIDQQYHVGLQYSDIERALKLDGDKFLADAILNASMSRLAQQIDSYIAGKILQFPSWVGTAGNSITTIAGFNAMPQQLDNGAVPTTDRNAVLSPADWWGLANSFTSNNFFDNNINKDALQKAHLPLIGGCDPYMTQSLPVLTCGTRTNGTVAGANQNVNYTSVANTYTQTLNVAGLGANATVAAGEVFTIAGVFAVNPATQQTLPYLQQFTVVNAATADGTGAAALTITLPIIAATGAGTALLTNTAFQTVSAAPANGAVITWKGTASASYVQNAAFHKSAIQYAFVKPPQPHTGEYKYATDPETGISLRLWAFSDGVNDTHSHRVDVLFGATNMDPRLGTRGSGA